MQHRPTREARSAPGIPVPPDASSPAARARVRRQQRIIWYRVGLASAVTMLRSRRFHERVILGAVALAALAGMAKENQTRTMGRLVAWDKRRILRAQRRADVGRPPAS
jgi:hypothetical protein